MISALAQLNDAAARVAMYSAAVQLGLLDAIDREPATATELAARCGASNRGVTLLLASLADDGFVTELPGGRYEPAAPGLASLHPMLPMWDHLTETIRTGVPALEMDSPDTAVEIYPQLVASLANLWQDAADRAARILPPPLDILDVGAGAAPWSIALAKHHPESRVTALDLPAVLTTTRRAVAAAGLTHQFDFLQGNIFQDGFPDRSYDLILVGQFCHLFDAAICAKLVHHLKTMLTPDGTLAIMDGVAGSDHSAAYELSLYLRTKDGRLHPESAYAQWLADADLTMARPIEINTSPTIMLITATNADKQYK
jgi:hypothetical protein